MSAVQQATPDLEHFVVKNSKGQFLVRTNFSLPKVLDAELLQLADIFGTLVGDIRAEIVKRAKTRE